MENVNWLKLKLNEKMMNLQSSKANVNADLSSNNAATKNLIQQTQNNIINQVQNQIVNPQQLRMNNLASIDRAVYVKNLLNLPKNMVELLVMVQNEGKNQTQQAQNQQQPTNPQNPQNVLNQAQNQPQTAQNLQQNGLNQIPNRQQNTQNNQNIVQQPNLPVQNQNTNTNLQKLPVIPTNPQVQPPEQQQIQNQTQQVKEQKPNYQQQNQNSHTPEKTDENVPQKQIQANKEAFTQQMNNAKQEASTQINKQVQTNQPQVAQNQPQVQQQNLNRPQVQQPQIQQPVAQQPTMQQPQQQPVLNQPVQQHNNLPINNGQKPIHVNQNSLNEINRTIQNEHFNNVESKSNQHNNLVRNDNLRQDSLQNDRMPILDKGEKFIQNTKQNIQQNALFGPHNQLHNNIRNSIRQPIILHQPPQPPPDIESLEQMQANNLQKTQGMTAEELAQFKQRMAAQLNENVNLTSVSALLQKNSKLAMNKMVSMMTLATAQGMTDIKPLQDTVNIINASVAATSQNDATQTLKNLMLLYLPWLPLQEGVGFDLEIEQDEDLPESDTFIKIMITTINFGNLNATVSLITGNSVDIAITCSEKFPKKELFKRLSKDGFQHSMQTAIDIKEQKPQEQIETQNAKAKVNLANVNQVNPYLLLMAHAIIRHTIELDATISIGKQPIEDN